MIFILT